MSRVMEISTPLGEDVLLFRSMSANEELGRLFEFHIEVLCERDDINPDDLLGQNVTVKLELPHGGQRCFDGYVTRFGYSGYLGRYHRFQLTARPWLWLLTRTSDCRIFQNKTVPEILAQVFDKYPAAAFESRLTGSYSPKDYCVQYRETDFNFVSRLMEQEGIYYFFEHQDGKHTLVLADGPSAHVPFPGYDSIPFVPHDRGGRLEQEYVAGWFYSREIQPGAYVIDDFDFIKPSTDLRVSTRRQREHAQATGEYYDYPGEYRNAADGEHYVKIRLEELQARHELVEGAGNARGLAVGALFCLTGHPRVQAAREHLVVRSTLELEYNEYEAQASTGASFRCSFAVLDSRETFRPMRVTPKPTVQGPQTAIVVGPSADEIHTDEFGRVKLQFHWDRRGESNENSSCWVRVSHPWAGKNFGMIAIPRIGQEVIVDFLEGDPDCPMITGRVYNKEHMPPWTLTEHKTRTGIVTRSTKGGSTSNANELRFEDKKGEEEVYVHAERQLRTEVEVDELRDVGRDRTTNIHGHDKLTVDKERHEHVKGDQRKLTVDKLSDRTIKGGEVEDISKGLKTTIHGGHQHTVTDGGQIIKVTGDVQEDIIGGFLQTASNGIDFTTPMNFMATATAGITLNTPAVATVIGGTGVVINTPKLDIIGGAKITAVTPDESNIKGNEFAVVGIKGEMVGVAMSTTGVNIEQKQLEMAATTCKVEVVNVDVESETLKSITAALHVSNPATQIVMGSLALAKVGIKIIG
ncbi:type VI secretion system Vgr family protein [Caldimonas brevitalea]|uniref:Uncharacterized protein n=1 Tax=Caldimonas brevitalea TaxID=413882 RepID=A0A0G3BQR4_9BURK|nr:type VI secretion system tip protein VgrG [Caldimonas brevitalea]AKJ28880.1 hypothetical protein AAW51_2189 [Caldimonas brevitalea]